MVTGWGSGPPGFSAPNEMFEGTEVTVAARAAAASRRPAPIHCASTGVPKSSVVTSCALELIRAERISAGVIVGRACLTNAAAPAVNGAAKLVPSLAAYPLVLNREPAGSDLCPAMYIAGATGRPSFRQSGLRA